MEKEVNEVSETEELEVKDSKAYPKTSDWGDLAKRMDDDKPKKGKKGLKVLLIILIIILVLFASLVVYLKFIKPDSKKVYMNILKDFKDEMSEVYKETKESAGSMSIHTNMKDYKIFDNASLDYSYTSEDENKLSEITYKEDGKKVINGTVFLTGGKYYIYSEDIYSKPLLLNSEKADNNAKADDESSEYVIDKTGDYLKESLSNAEYKTTYGILKINDGKVFAQKNIVKIDKETGNKIKNEFLNQIKDDSKYIKALSITSGLSTKDIETNIEDLISEDIDTNLEMEIDNNFFTNNLLKVNIKVDNKDFFNMELSSDVTYNVTLYNETEKYEGVATIRDDEISFETETGNYKYNISIKEEKDSATIRIKATDKNGKYFAIDIENYEKDVNIKEIDIKKAKDIQKMKDSEIQELSSNIEKLMKKSEVFSNLMEQ